MKYLVALIAVFTLAACNESGGGSTEAAKVPTDSFLPGADDPGVADPGDDDGVVDPGTSPVTVALTLYSKTRTLAPSASYPAVTFTATATCFEYNSRQFCWDDGLHTTLGGPIPFKDNYFGFQASPTTGAMQACKISCADSYMEPIREILNRTAMLTVIGGNLGQEVDSILSSGTPTLTSCTDDGSTLTCGNVVVNL